MSTTSPQIDQKNEQYLKQLLANAEIALRENREVSKTFMADLQSRLAALEQSKKICLAPGGKNHAQLLEELQKHIDFIVKGVAPAQDDDIAIAKLKLAAGTSAPAVKYSPPAWMAAVLIASANSPFSKLRSLPEATAQPNGQPQQVG